MRIRIAHVTTYQYDMPAKVVTQVLRLTPRDYDGQHVIGWRIEPDPDTRLRAGEDALGNLTHSLFYSEPLERVTITVSGEVQTLDTGGVVSGLAERFPPEVFLRETPLTAADDALAGFSKGIMDAGGSTLSKLHRLMAGLVEAVAYDTGSTEVTGTAAQAFAQKSGVCQDLSHIFIAAARVGGVPARYVSGHLVREDGAVDQQAAHAWAEAYVEDLGWVGFDAANGVCPTDAYVRVAVGFDYLGASPVRGARYGGGGEQMTVKLRVADAAVQQTQS